METLYLIIFLGGTGGNFVEQLMSMMLVGKSNNMIIANDASAHTVNIRYQCRMSNEYFQNHLNIDNAYKYIDSGYSEKYGILLDHLVPKWDELFSMFPNSQTIIITVPEKKLAPRIAGNMYYKTINVNTHAWHELKNNDIFSIYNSPDDVPVNLLQTHFNDIVNYYDKIYTAPFNGSITYSDNRIHTISYYDMLYNPSIVLETLSRATGKDVPSGIMIEYQKYLDAQDKLVREKMPWINDR